MPMAVPVDKKEDIVYVDKSGIDRHLHRRNARSAKEKDQQRGKRCLALWPGRNFRGGTLSPGMPMARPLPNVFTITPPMAKSSMFG
ncbi:MAG: hypothetical protein LBF42_03770 [Puniceicoccales bacterium]|nr:hypothetical protein [Puniceicoccales bacterium]